MVLLIIAMLVFSGPMKMIAAADDSDLFFATFSFITNNDKLPVPETETDSRLPAVVAGTSTAELRFAALFNQENLAVGQEFRIRVMVDPAGQSINLVDAELYYSTSTLYLVEIDTTNSDFSLNLIGNTNLGTASLIAMQPWPGVATSSLVADLVFLSLAPGTAEVDFRPESTVLANDGYGTDVLKSAEAIDFIID